MRRFLYVSAIALLVSATLGMIAFGQGHNAHAAATPAPALHVSGTTLRDANNTVVRLHGVDHSGTEYNCIQNAGIFDNGQPDQAFVDHLLAEHANSVRIPMNEDCWLGINGAPAAYSGANYQNAIQQWVSLLVSNGITPILELHWNAPGATTATGQQPMPDADHSITFWSQVAAAYKGQPGAIFDLYNEPYPNTWACWRDGGAACNGDVPFAVAGMQQLVNTVRQAGANNVLMLGCLDYANTCNGNGGSWQQYAPTDAQHNLAASWHVYLGNPCVDATCWDNELAPVLAAGYPLINGEFGAYKYDGTQYTPSFGQAILDWLDQHQASGYNAWTWNNWGYSSSDAEAMITASDGSALSPWGQWVQQQYATRFAAGGGAPSPTATQTNTPAPTATQTNTPSPSPTTSPAPSPTSAPPSGWCPSSGEMLCNGFESGKLPDTWSSTAVGAGNSLSVVGAPVESGTHALNTTVTAGGNGTALVYKTWATGYPAVYASLWYDPQSTATSGVTHPVSLWTDGGSTFVAWIAYTPSTGALALEYGYNGSSTCGGHTLPAGSGWHHLELGYDASASGGTVTVALDGTTLCTITGAVSGGPTSKTVDTVNVGADTAAGTLTQTAYVDDVAIATSFIH